MSEPRTRWARVRLVLFGGVDGFASVISAPASIFRGEERKGASGRRLTQAGRRNLHFAGIGGEEPLRSGARLDIASLCPDRRQSASICSLFVLNENNIYSESTAYVEQLKRLSNGGRVIARTPGPHPGDKAIQEP
jgi:hypothetical protein